MGDRKRARTLSRLHQTTICYVRGICGRANTVAAELTWYTHIRYVILGDHRRGTHSICSYRFGFYTNYLQEFTTFFKHHMNFNWTLFIDLVISKNLFCYLGEGSLEWYVLFLLVPFLGEYHPEVRKETVPRRLVLGGYITVCPLIRSSLWNDE